MGVFARVSDLLGRGFSFDDALREASKEAQERQKAEFQKPGTREKWGLKGKTPEEQRRIDEKLAQGDPEAKG